MLLADCIARFNRIQGKKVFFLAGTDEHGEKVEKSATAAGMNPKQFVDEISKNFKDLWLKLNISNDYFIRTTDKNHEETVKKVLMKLYEKGDIYKGMYEGWYCIPCESYYDENELKEGKCPSCGREVIREKEETYFFKMSKYENQLREWLSKNPIIPDYRKNEMLNFFKDGLKDLSITRKNVKWGIKAPFDESHTVYVWSDALLNYLSAVNYPEGDFEDYWPPDVQIMGKDIARFHAVYWPAMLFALDLKLPEKIIVHNFWVASSGEKMSKSKGNVIDPARLIQTYGLDQIRYFILKEMNFSGDSDFDEKNLIQTINNDLSEELGNLLNRTMVMSEKYFNSEIQKPEKQELKEAAEQTIKKFSDFMNEYQVDKALREVWVLIKKANKYVNDKKPWSNEEDRKTIIYNLIESLRVISVLLEPFIPEKAVEIRKQLGVENKSLKWSGSTSGKNGERKILFPRIEES
jgi:methionyl-tRNA synthetase